MKVFRARHDNVPESPVRTLYGRKGNLLLLPLDVCVVHQSGNGGEEFRPEPEDGRLVAAPVQEAGGGRLGLIAHYEWPPRAGRAVNPVVTVQLAPSASAAARGVDDLRVVASLCDAGDRVYLIDGGGERRGGVLRSSPPDWNAYPDAAHRVRAHRVHFDAPLERTAHGAAVRLEGGGELIGMLLATQNQPDGGCRALVYPA